MKLEETEEKFPFERKAAEGIRMVQKENILPVLKASNIKAQEALTSEFPKVASKFDITRKGMLSAAAQFKRLKTVPFVATLASTATTASKSSA